MTISLGVNDDRYTRRYGDNDRVDDHDDTWPLGYRRRLDALNNQSIPT